MVITVEIMVKFTRTGTWGFEENLRFLEAVYKLKLKGWNRIAEYVGTRTSKQCRSHHQKEKTKPKKSEEGVQCNLLNDDMVCPDFYAHAAPLEDIIFDSSNN